jgi:hypothetical protein
MQRFLSGSGSYLLRRAGKNIQSTQLATRQASTSANQPDNRLQFRGFD